MGAGGVFGLFIQEYEKMEIKARARLANVTSFDINSTMKRVVGRFDDTRLENVFSKFVFGIESGKGNNPRGLITGGLFDTDSGVSVDYRVSWPLDLVFTKRDFAVYNRVFIFTIRLRHCISALASLTLDRSHKNPRVNGLMTHFLESLWSYIQMDVFQVEFAKISVVVNGDSGRDFEELGRRHGLFVDAVEKGVFLDGEGRVVYEGLMKAFGEVGEFCRGGDGSGFEEGVEELWRGVEKGGRGVERLLVRVDFNRWYSIGKREV
jgi:hypothetical protein